MKHLSSSLLALFIVSGALFIGCKGDEGSDPTPTDNNNNNTVIPELNIVVYDGDTVKMTEITCAPNSFGKPRFVFSTKNEDQSISAKIELRGTAPEDGTSFTIDPDLDNGTSTVKFYYDGKNWTGKLDPSNSVDFRSDDTKKNVQASKVLVVNNADDQETMTVDFNLTCTE